MTNIFDKPFGNTSLPGTRHLAKHLSAFFAFMVGTSVLCLSGYALTVDRLIERSAIPATYKWFLLKEIPGPRIIFESGSNSHHAIDTDAIGEALGRTAINVADNGGYALEDKLTRLETYTIPGDIVVLPLEWTFYSREKLTDNYVDTLFDSNRDYYHSMPLDKRVKRALSLPPATVVSKLANRQTTSREGTESPAQDLFVSALIQPTGHQSREVSSGPNADVVGQSCDDYILGKAPIRQNLKLGKNIKPALRRLQKLKADGVKIHFAWPVLTGEACLTSPAYVEDFRAEIEAAVNNAGFEFLGTPSQSLYGQKFQDDTPYHIITEATNIHTRQMIGFLKAQGYGTTGEPLNITNFARHRLLELELSEASDFTPTPLELGKTVSFDNADQRDQIDFTAGWWGFEPYGRWMRDNRAMFRVTLPENLPPNTVLKLQGITKSGRPERTNISVNGSLVSSGLFGESVSLSVPMTGLPQGEALSIFIELPEAGLPRSPADLGESQDARSMTLHLQNMVLTDDEDMPVTTRIEPAKDNSTPEVINPLSVTNLASSDIAKMPENFLTSETPFGTIPTLTSSCIMELPENVYAKTRIRFGDGWWAQEPEGRWMRTEEASFELKIPESVRMNGADKLTLRLVGDFFSEMPQSVGVKINDKTEGIASITKNGILSLPFETIEEKDYVNITLKVTTPNPKSPRDLGLSMDERRLTYFLKSAELLPT